MRRRTGTPRKGKRTATIAAGAIAALCGLMAAPAAQAGALVASAEGCASPALEQPFLPWLDSSEYFLAPNGGFESGASKWSLDGAAVVSGNEPYYAHGADESKSLSIPSGASATTATSCVGIAEPTVRLFVKSDSASLLSKLKVEVLYEDALGNVRAAPVGAVPALTSTSWTPHVPMVIGVNLLALVGDKTPVKFRLSAQGSADWQIDDFYVDPRFH